MISASEGRRFAWTLSAGFAVFGAASVWRRHHDAALVFGALTAVSFTAGAVVPRRLGSVKRGWMAFGEALSKVTSPVFFAAVYFVVLTPMGLLRRTFGRSPLARASHATTYWHRREARTPEEARRSLEHLF